MASSSELQQNTSSMDVERILHMKEGLGDTSYAQNSSFQKKGIDALKHIMIKSAVDLYKSKTPRTLKIADLGCSSGPNTLSAVGSIVDAVNKSCREMSRPPPEFLVFLNDLATNDFNTVFVKVQEFIKKVKDDGGPSVFMAGVPGSFYGRLFPDRSLHFVCSSFSLHWLSQLPRGLFDKEGKPTNNKGKMYISQTTPREVIESYHEQFLKDFNLFLKSRSEELINGGRIVLAMSGRMSSDHFDKRTCLLWEVLAQALAIMVSQKLLQQEKLDSYNVPFYAPSAEEMKDAVLTEGSFEIDHVQAYELSTSSGIAAKDAAVASMSVRAIQESMIAHHFGEEIIETLFQIYRDLLCEAMEREEYSGAFLVVVLRKFHDN